jgi:hypothetical protein
VRAWALPILSRILREAGCASEGADRVLEEEACGALGAWAFCAFHLGRPRRTVTFDSPRSIPSLFAHHMRLAAFAEEHSQRVSAARAARAPASAAKPAAFGDSPNGPPAAKPGAGIQYSQGEVKAASCPAPGLAIRRRSPSDRQLLREYEPGGAGAMPALRDAEAPALAGFPLHRLREVREIRDELFRDYKWALPGDASAAATYEGLALGMPRTPPASFAFGSEANTASFAFGSEANTASATSLPNFRAVLSLCPNLRRLHLDGFVDVGALAAALRPLPRLESLTLRSASCSGDTMALLLAKLAACAPGLARLSFRPAGCLWEPNCFDDPVRAAPALLPALREIEVGAVRDAAHVLSGWAADRAFCGRAERVVVTSQPPSLARLRPPLPDPFAPALELLRAAPRLLHLGVGMDSVCTVFSRRGGLPQLLAAAGEHPALRCLMARTDCFHASPDAAPLRARRLRSIAALLDAHAWAQVEAELLVELPRGEAGREAAAGGPFGESPKAASPIQRVPWHFCSIRDRVAAFVGAPARGTRPHIFHFQIDMNLWEESDDEGEGEGK